METTNIKIQVPITVTYAALEAAARQKMVGEYITQKDDKGEEVKYAQILDIGIEGSGMGGYDLILAIKLTILRTVFKRERVDLYVQAALGYDNERQFLYLKKYKVDAGTQSRLYNSSIEVLANKVLYDRVLKKASFNLKELIGKEVGKVNSMLESGVEVKGVKLTGAIENIQIQDIAAQSGRMALTFLMSGRAEAEVFDLTELIKAKEVGAGI